MVVQFHQPTTCAFGVTVHHVRQDSADRMAEIVGTIASGLSLAALFKACIEAFELVQLARQQEADYKRLLLKLNIEKCRLYTWGETMKLTTAPQADAGRPLDTFQFRGLVVQALASLHELFNDTHKIKERYGCQEASSLIGDIGGDPELFNLSVAFSHFQSGADDNKGPNLGRKAMWVVRDRRKFAELVVDVRELIDGLQEITKSISPVMLQESRMVNRITSTAEIHTLDLVSEVCEQDHPVLSQAASLRSEILSMPEEQRADVEAWLADATPPVDFEVMELENLNLVELKHYILSHLASSTTPRGAQTQEQEQEQEMSVRMIQETRRAIEEAESTDKLMWIINVLLPVTGVTSVLATLSMFLGGT